MDQRSLDLPFPELAADQPLLPARMVNEYVYCPRLAYLEWVQGEWAESADTVEGSHGHRRVNRPGGKLPPAAELAPDDRIHARSITLSSNELGLIARMDLIESDAGRVVPVDYKRGRRPHVERGAYDPERVQLCVQGMLLEEHGYDCDEGVLYYVASRERVGVPFDEELRALTRSAMEGLRGASRRRSRTAPSARAARSCRSACPTRSISCTAVPRRRPDRSPSRATRRCRCTCRPAAPRSPRRARI